MKIIWSFQELTEGFHVCTPKSKNKTCIKISACKLKIQIMDAAKYTKCNKVYKISCRKSGIKPETKSGVQVDLQELKIGSTRRNFPSRD